MAAPDDTNPLAKAVGEFLATEGIAAVRPAARPVRPTAPAARPTMAEAYDAVVADEARKARERAKPEQTWRRTLAWGVALAAVLSASGYVWFGQPAFLAVQIEPARAPTTSIASRRTLISVSLLIEDFQVTSGRPPTALSELGVALPTVGYIPHANGEYELRLGSGVHALTLRGGPGHAEPEIQE